jgi:hypothetical protein
MAMAAYIIGMQEIASLTSPKKELLSSDFFSSSRMTGNPEIMPALGRCCDRFPIADKLGAGPAEVA